MHFDANQVTGSDIEHLQSPVRVTELISIH